MGMEPQCPGCGWDWNIHGHDFPWMSDTDELPVPQHRGHQGDIRRCHLGTATPPHLTFAASLKSVLVFPESQRLEKPSRMESDPRLVPSPECHIQEFPGHSSGDSLGWPLQTSLGNSSA